MEMAGEHDTVHSTVSLLEMTLSALSCLSYCSPHTVSLKRNQTCFQVNTSLKKKSLVIGGSHCNTLLSAIALATFLCIPQAINTHNTHPEFFLPRNFYLQLISEKKIRALVSSLD